MLSYSILFIKIGLKHYYKSCNVINALIHSSNEKFIGLMYKLTELTSCVQDLLALRKYLPYIFDNLT